MAGWKGLLLVAVETGCVCGIPPLLVVVVAVAQGLNDEVGCCVATAGCWPLKAESNPSRSLEEDFLGG